MSQVIFNPNAFPYLKSRYQGPGGVTPPTVWLSNPQSTSDVAITATSYTNLLVAPGGAAVTLSGSKAAGKNLLVFMSFCFQPAATLTLSLGLNYGSGDFDVAFMLYTFGSFNENRPTTGELLLTGVPTGAFTLTARVKVNTSTANYLTGYTSTFRAMECDP